MTVKKRLLFGLVALALIVARPQAVDAQCQRCHDCQGFAHRNTNTYTAFVGNLDGEHECAPQTCDNMFAQGVHLDEFQCQRFAAYNAVKPKKTLTDAEAVLLAKAYPRNVVLSRNKGLVTVLNCDGKTIFAQFKVSFVGEPRVAVRQRRSVVTKA